MRIGRKLSAAQAGHLNRVEFKSHVSKTKNPLTHSGEERGFVRKSFVDFGQFTSDEISLPTAGPFTEPCLVVRWRLRDFGSEP